MVMECDCGGGHFLEFRPLTVCTVRVVVGQFYCRLLLIIINCLCNVSGVAYRWVILKKVIEGKAYIIYVYIFCIYLFKLIWIPCHPYAENPQ